MLTDRILTDTHHKKAHELCELLPWYVNKTLDEVEMRAVEQHLQHCGECAGELPILQAVPVAVDNESVAVFTPRPNTEQFLAHAKQRKLRRQVHTATWIAGALAASLAGFALVLNWIQTDDSAASSTVYETATNAGSGASFDYVLHVAFEKGVDSRARGAALQALGPESIAGPDSAGYYRVVIRLPARSMDELQKFAQKVESNSVIASAAIVAVELPVEAP